jgi:hypothetical protein
MTSCPHGQGIEMNRKKRAVCRGVTTVNPKMVVRKWEGTGKNQGEKTNEIKPRGRQKRSKIKRKT